MLYPEYFRLVLANTPEAVRQARAQRGCRSALAFSKEVSSQRRYQMQLSKEEKITLACLRENARVPLTRLSRNSGLPVSTLFDRLSTRFTKMIEKFTALLNFNALGYTARAFIILKVKREDRPKLQACLEKNRNLNSLYKINNSFDFMAEMVFSTMAELENFSDRLEEEYALLQKDVYYVISDIHRERFLSSPELVQLEQPAKPMVRLRKSL